jgi:hypothetical protein
VSVASPSNRALLNRRLATAFVRYADAARALALNRLFLSRTWGNGTIA